MHLQQVKELCAGAFERIDIHYPLYTLKWPSHFTEDIYLIFIFLIDGWNVDSIVVITILSCD